LSSSSLLLLLLLHDKVPKQSHTHTHTHTRHYCTRSVPAGLPSILYCMQKLLTKIVFEQNETRGGGQQKDKNVKRFET